MRFNGRKDFNCFLYVLEGVGYDTTPLLEYMKGLKKGEYICDKDISFYYDNECIMCVIECFERTQIAIWKKRE